MAKTDTATVNSSVSTERFMNSAFLAFRRCGIRPREEKRLDERCKEEKCREGHQSGTLWLPQHCGTKESVDDEDPESNEHPCPDARQQVGLNEIACDPESQELDHERH